MYRTVVIGVFVSTLVVIVVDFVLRILFHRKQRTGGAMQTTSLFCRVSRMCVNMVGFVCFAAVAGSGFYTFLTKGNVLTGYRLMVHVGTAAVFAGASVAMTLFWAHRNRFTPSDWSRLRRPLASADTYPILLRKFFFWTAVTLSVPTMASIVMAMFPLPSPNQQQDLFLIHRYCALPLAAAGLLFAYFAFVTWKERQVD